MTMTNKKFDAVPKSVQIDLDNMSVKLNAISTSHKVEQVGYFIWVSNTEKTDKDAYNNLGMRWSPKRNQWYFAHPQSPKRKYKQRPKANSKPTPMNAVRDKYSHTKIELSERDKLEQELANIEKMFTVDSGENHINLAKMRGYILSKLLKLDNVEDTDATVIDNTEKVEDEDISKEDAVATLRDLFSSK